MDAYRDCNNAAAQEPALNPNPLFLKDGALKFAVGNDYLSVGQPAAQVSGTNKLFHLPDTSTVGAPDGSKIYAAFNRVISLDRDPTRIGTGVRRIMITLE